MENELNRLATFTNWPGNAPVDSARIAKGGFYATGNGTEVECFWCHKKISDWRYGDQVMVRHRELDPLCPFTIDPRSCGNVSMLNQVSPVQATIPSNDLMNESCRLATFKNWPVPYITPESLAKAGFYYYNESDRVTCVWCRGVMAKWEVGDNPFTEHQKYFPNCPRVALGPNIELPDSNINDIGIQQIQAAKVEALASLDARIRTFSQWPFSDIQTPTALATAGFYYLDFNDQVRCFHCNGGLRSWQKDDDPWFEHAKWFPKCQFVQLVKGNEYVGQVKASSKPSLDEAMSTEPVQTALQMGLNVGRIRAATKQRLESVGKPYANVETLVDAVLDGQLNGAECEEEDSGQSSSNIVREVSRILDHIFNPRTQSHLSAETNESEEAIQSIEHATPAAPRPEPLSENSTNNVPDNSASLNVSGLDEQQLTEVSAQLSLEEENRKLKDARSCKVCMDAEVAVVFLPCGHLVACAQCAIGVYACPMCRTSIKAYVRAFLS